ncbi:porin family protein [Flavobacterium chilense]|uniref:Outer membrane protein beta-barrel domain-containing protein n=1 Tax=Flavobacterium chilense TaxID=946677 RepID=A0A1M7CN99_9FLAO|nr:porin family protein [Flavobacterium chilense]SHL68309.1 Outer membrane protein beta-barrel domain-containing protein [Flavobacterium chilense]
MKKITVIALVLFIGITSLKAQVKVSPGFRGGLNISDLTNMPGNTSAKSDFYVGALVAIKFNKYFTLQPELNYSRQGSDVRLSYLDFENVNSYPRNKKAEINYITLGAVGKFHFKGSGFHVLAGPSVDFKTDDNFDKFGTDPVGVDFAIVGGLGYTLPNGLTFEARYKQGVIDIYGYDGINYNNNNNDYYYNDLILNQVFQIGISYTFKTK